LEKIRTAIIGTGKVGNNHARALQMLPESDFVAACGIDPEQTQTFANQYGVKAYSNVGDMVLKSRVQVVIVATPHPAHASAALQAIQAGAHVLVEKPLAANLADCDAMIAAANSARVKLGMVSQRRYYPPVERVRAAIDAGKIGRPLLGTIQLLGWRDQKYYALDAWRGTWKNEGGGVLVNQAPHQIDLLQWFMGPVEELFGYWDNLNHPYIEVEDTAVAVLRFKHGGVGTILLSNSQKPGLFGKVHVHGENGASLGVQTDGGAMFVAGVSGVLEPPMNDLWTVPGEEALLAQWQAEDRAAFSAMDAVQFYFNLQDQNFLRAVLEDRPAPVSGEEGRKTVEIFTAIYRSQRDRQPVRFPLAPETGQDDLDGRLVVQEK
jgi:UDP-N-acetyl-2-amino-2-deoxyglucuronate dehydrogenase